MDGHVRTALGRGVASVVGLGGDGTQRAIASVLEGTDVPLGILPGCTGNILGGVLGVPTGLKAAIAALDDRRPRTIDLADVSLYTTDLAPGAAPRRTISAIGCGIGFDARLMATTPSASKARFGRYAYLLQAIRLASNIKPVPYRITVDGELYELDAAIAMVTNVGDLVPGVIRRSGYPRCRMTVARPVRGRRHGVIGGVARAGRSPVPDPDRGDADSRTLRFRCTSVRLESTPPEPIQVDGDPCGIQGRHRGRHPPRCVAGPGAGRDVAPGIVTGPVSFPHVIGGRPLDFPTRHESATGHRRITAQSLSGRDERTTSMGVPHLKTELYRAVLAALVVIVVAGCTFAAPLGFP